MTFSDDFPVRIVYAKSFPRTYPNISEKIFPKIFEDVRKKFDLIRSYTKKLKYSLRVKHDIRVVVNIFTREDMENTPLESRM